MVQILFGNTQWRMMKVMTKYASMVTVNTPLCMRFDELIEGMFTTVNCG